MCLSTCNRTELYVVARRAKRRSGRRSRRSPSSSREVEPALYRLRDQAAALHLFRVAAGLDSLVPGEGEILGQVRAAYEAGTPGLVLDRVFRQALHAGRKVRAQTAIGESPASVSVGSRGARRAGVRRPRRLPRSCCIGAGKISEPGCAQPAHARRRDRVVANRTIEHGEDRAEARRAALLDAGRRELVSDDDVSARVPPTRAPTRTTVERARKGRQLLFIDLAVPRDLDPAIHELDGCYLYDIDDLEAIVTETLSGRRGEAARAEAIVAGGGRASSASGRRRSTSCRRSRRSARSRRRSARRELLKAEGVLGRLDDARAQARRIDDLSDRRKAPASADRAHEAGGACRPTE